MLIPGSNILNINIAKANQKAESTSTNDKKAKAAQEITKQSTASKNKSKTRIIKTIVKWWAIAMFVAVSAVICVKAKHITKSRTEITERISEKQKNNDYFSQIKAEGERRRKKWEKEIKRMKEENKQWAKEAEERAKRAKENAERARQQAKEAEEERKKAWENYEKQRNYGANPAMIRVRRQASAGLEIFEKYGKDSDGKAFPEIKALKSVDTVSEEELTLAHRKLIKLYHPDRNTSHEATQIMQSINPAKDNILAYIRLRTK